MTFTVSATASSESWSRKSNNRSRMPGAVGHLRAMWPTARTLARETDALRSLTYSQSSVTML